MNNTVNNNDVAVKPVAWLEKHLNQGVVVYLLLSWVTLGIYPIVFGFKLTRLLTELEKDTGRTDGALRIMLLTGLGGLAAYLVGVFLSGFSAFFGIIALIGFGVGVVQSIRWAFHARAIMVEYYAKVHGFPIVINGFLLFFFANIMLLLAANNAERSKQLHESVR